jgi:carbonic anhydrase/acetyltransferase-like protein (isoleucine patch superfamily)
LIPEGKEIPDNSMVFGTPGKVVREVTAQEIVRITESALHYMKKVRIYKNELQSVRIG